MYEVNCFSCIVKAEHISCRNYFLCLEQNNVLLWIYNMKLAAEERNKETMHSPVTTQHTIVLQNTKYIIREKRRKKEKLHKLSGGSK